MQHFDLPQTAVRRIRPATQHGGECPRREWTTKTGDTLPCMCVSCHCPKFKPAKGEAGACGHCFRPLIKNGKVVRVYG